MSFGKWTQNFFYPRNKEKYLGSSPPFYRSSWELRVMNYFDLNKNVLHWSSEKYIVPYRLGDEVDKLGRPKIRRYIIDFYCEMKGDLSGEVRKFLVEVKPKSQGEIPALPKNPKKTKSYKFKALTYAINKAKWDAAEQYCQKKGFRFLVLTEDEIYSMNV